MNAYMLLSHRTKKTCVDMYFQPCERIVVEFHPGSNGVGNYLENLWLGLHVIWMSPYVVLLYYPMMNLPVVINFVTRQPIHRQTVYKRYPLFIDPSQWAAQHLWRFSDRFQALSGRQLFLVILPSLLKELLPLWR